MQKKNWLYVALKDTRYKIFYQPIIEPKIWAIQFKSQWINLELLKFILNKNMYNVYTFLKSIIVIILNNVIEKNF